MLETQTNKVVKHTTVADTWQLLFADLPLRSHRVCVTQALPPLLNRQAGLLAQPCAHPAAEGSPLETTHQCKQGEQH